MGYANVFRPIGGIPIFPSGKRSENVVTRPVPNIRHASSGGNASTDLAIGDFYALDENGNAYRAGPNDVVVGLVHGWVLQGNPNVMAGQGPISVDYVSGAPASGSWPNLIGIEDPTIDISIQADTFAAAQLGAQINLLDAAPDPTYRQSRQSVVVATPGIQLKVMGLVNYTSMNAYGANAQVFVRMIQSLQG
jgi:hypothetical protein